MKANAIYTILVAASLALSTAVSAQTGAQYGGSDSKATGESRQPTNPQYGEGGSKHCDQLTDAKKQECLQDEGAKTDRKQEPSAAAPGSSASGASSAPSRDTAPDAKGINATQSED